jgi:hypothetical protein
MYTVTEDGPGLQETIASENTSRKDMFDIQLSLYEAARQVETTVYIASGYRAHVTVRAHEQERQVLS